MIIFIVAETLSLLNFCQSSGIRQYSVNVDMCPSSLYTWINFGLFKIFMLKNKVAFHFYVMKGNCWAIWGSFCAVHYQQFTLVPTGFQQHCPGYLKRLVLLFGSIDTIMFFDITAKWKKG